jgi:hypothetical protein
MEVRIVEMLPYFHGPIDEVSFVLSSISPLFHSTFVRGSHGGVALPVPPATYPSMQNLTKELLAPHPVGTFLVRNSKSLPAACVIISYARCPQYLFLSF